jgi:S-methylmethionine-dependent homocysteine/selenocysteine methylase
LIICFETYIVIIFNKCGFDVVAIESINKKAIAMAAEIRRKMEAPPDTKIVLVGKIGPRGDSFFPDKSRLMTSKEAEEYHSQQINWLAATEVDMVKNPHSSNSFLMENFNFLFIIDSK